MNDRDRQNLNFLMSIDKETLGAWYRNFATPDDIAYATSLLMAAELELMVKGMESKETDPYLDCTEAQQILSKFTLKGK